MYCYCEKTTHYHMICDACAVEGIHRNAGLSYEVQRLEFVDSFRPAGNGSLTFDLCAEHEKKKKGEIDFVALAKEVMPSNVVSKIS